MYLFISDAVSMHAQTRSNTNTCMLSLPHAYYAHTHPNIHTRTHTYIYAPKHTGHGPGASDRAAETCESFSHGDAGLGGRTHCRARYEKVVFGCNGRPARAALRKTPGGRQ